MPFADEMISASTAAALARAIAAATPGAGLPRLRESPGLLADLTLRERADLLRDALLADVPGGYDDLARVVRAARDAAPSFDGWMMWPVTAAVATRAVDDGGTAAFDDAMGLLAELTGLLTSEFAIRTLVRHAPERALAIVLTWTGSDDTHVRRLASEGTRPYLPWAVRVPELTRTPGATVPVLDALYRDPAEYVRRSVANHLNDLSRDHPALVVETAARWLTDPDENTAWVVRRGLRTLVKRGDPGALGLLGFSATAASLRIDGPHLDRDTVAFGESVELRSTVRNVSDEDVRLAIDYVVHHQKSNGSQRPTTFKLTTVSLRSGESIVLRKAHSFRPITTRRYYPGLHGISLQINGIATERAEFELVTG
ncbi:DNA alkylation repair protein [Georgenia sp. MJ206]|uniref:DNA alkylation repair protein n=1 Tax=Georgenia wangjunii TaxID=3117730 RepID=UPI002F26DB1B